MVAVWAEADLILADEFRDGNVPARREPLHCAGLAFAALPGSIREGYFRGDSARPARSVGCAFRPRRGPCASIATG